MLRQLIVVPTNCSVVGLSSAVSDWLPKHRNHCFPSFRAVTCLQLFTSQLRSNCGNALFHDSTSEIYPWVFWFISIVYVRVSWRSLDTTNIHIYIYTCKKYMQDLQMKTKQIPFVKKIIQHGFCSSRTVVYRDEESVSFSHTTSGSTTVLSSPFHEDMRAQEYPPEGNVHVKSHGHKHLLFSSVFHNMLICF